MTKKLVFIISGNGPSLNIAVGRGHSRATALCTQHMPPYPVTSARDANERQEESGKLSLYT